MKRLTKSIIKAKVDAINHATGWNLCLGFRNGYYAIDVRDTKTGQLTNTLQSGLNLHDMSIWLDGFCEGVMTN